MNQIAEMTEQDFKGYLHKKGLEFWGEEVPLTQLRVGYGKFIDVITQGQFYIKEGIPHIDIRRALDYDTFLNTLHHEFLHYYLYIKGIEHHDTSEPFIKECLRIGIPLSGASDAQVAYRRYREKSELVNIPVEEKLAVIQEALKEGYVYNIHYLHREDPRLIPWMGDLGEVYCQIRNPEVMEDRHYGVAQTIEDAIYLSWENWKKHRKEEKEKAYQIG